MRRRSVAAGDVIWVDGNGVRKAVVLRVEGTLLLIAPGTKACEAGEKETVPLGTREAQALELDYTTHFYAKYMRREPLAAVRDQTFLVAPRTLMKRLWERLAAERQDLIDRTMGSRSALAHTTTAPASQGSGTGGRRG